MIYRLRDLFGWHVAREIVPGVWVAARPEPGPLRSRLRAAWAVLRGRADALTWPREDDMTTWCAAPAPRYGTTAEAVQLVKDELTRAAQQEKQDGP